MVALMVIRSDSGDPVSTSLELIKLLVDKFGFMVNKKGYLILLDYIGVIQGDGIDIKSLENILKNLKDNKISADNIAFGIG